MGKSQKKRAMRRHNPMRVPDTHLPKGLEAAAESCTKREAILPLMQKMESADGAERRWACVAVSNLIQNDPATRRLLQGRNVVGALIARLMDGHAASACPGSGGGADGNAGREEEVAVEAAGALRNLCIDGGYEICAEMYNKGVLGPLQAFVPKISASLAQLLASPKRAIPENTRMAAYEFAENVITIFWCLSETSNRALNAINTIRLVPFLMSFFAARDSLPAATVTAAAQCLYVLTDDNQPAIDEVRADAAYASCLLHIVRETRPQSEQSTDAPPLDRFAMLNVLCCGILGNVAPLPPPSAVSAVDVARNFVFPLLQPIISSVCLDTAARQAQELAERQANEPPEIERASPKHAPKSDHRSPTQLELERLENRLRMVQLALEILTGACATLPDPDPGEDDLEDTQDEDADADMDANVGGNDGDGMVVDDASPYRASSVLSSHSLPALVQPLLALIRPTPLSFPPPAGASRHPPTTSALGAIHVSALECLNNILLSLAAAPHAQLCADTSAGWALWDAVWGALCRVGRGMEAGGGGTPGQEMWEIGVGVLWGIGKIWKGVLIPQEEHVRVLTEMCSASADAQVQVKCIGALECLAHHPESIEANKAISSYLLGFLPTTGVTPRRETERVFQAASALVDIYSDERVPYDVNFRDGKYEERLAASVEGIKGAVKAIDRRRERELRVRGEEVRGNLVAFVEYRRGLHLS